MSLASLPRPLLLGIIAFLPTTDIFGGLCACNRSLNVLSHCEDVWKIAFENDVPQAEKKFLNLPAAVQVSWRSSYRHFHFDEEVSKFRKLLHSVRLTDPTSGEKCAQFISIQRSPFSFWNDSPPVSTSLNYF
jgi:hypothetical protein